MVPLGLDLVGTFLHHIRHSLVLVVVVSHQDAHGSSSRLVNQLHQLTASVIQRIHHRLVLIQQ